MTIEFWLTPVALQQAQQGSITSTLLLFAIIFAIFYFLVMAPARKRQKTHQAMIEALERGDKVVTSGGLHGEVAAVEGAVVHLKLADNVKVKVSRAAIAEVGAEKGKKS